MTKGPHTTPDPGWCGDLKRGASFGRPSHAGAAPASAKFTLQRVRIDSGGYDPGGAYWGIGAPLYWYATDDGEVSSYLRASTRTGAKAKIRAMYPDARFWR